MTSVQIALKKRLHQRNKAIIMLGYKKDKGGSIDILVEICGYQLIEKTIYEVKSAANFYVIFDYYPCF